MVYKRVSSALFFSIVWMLLVCPKAYSQSNSMRSIWYVAEVVWGLLH